MKITDENIFHNKYSFVQGFCCINCQSSFRMTMIYSKVRKITYFFLPVMMF